MVNVDHAKEEGNEIEFKKITSVSDTEQADSNWRMGTNPNGKRDLFRSKHVTLLESDSG